MKKIIVAILAIITLASCVNEKIETPQAMQEITFGTSLTAYATKSGGVVLDNSNFTEFYVWGWATNRAGETTPVFEGTQVKKDQNGNWTYGDSSGKRYWVPNCTYTFRAVAPHLPLEFQQQYDGELNKFIYDENGLPEYFFGVWGNNGTSDYCFDTYIRQPSVSGYGPVEFEFQHLLSKLVISITNNVDPYINISISNIEIGAPTQGSIMDLDNIAWTGTNDTGSYSFDSIAQIEPYEDGETAPLFVIPTSADYEHPVSFDVTLTMDGVTPYLRTKTITGKISNKAFEMGTAYKLTAVIDANSIDSGHATFEVTQIPYWQVAEGETEVFSSLEKILIASKLGGVVTLTSDDQLEFANSVEVVDDFTITSAAVSKDANNKIIPATITYNGTTSPYLFYVSSNGATTNNNNGIATLTINGNNDNLSIISETASCLGVAEADGEIIINGGYHETAGSTVYKSEGGTININKGKFKSATPANLFSLADGSNGKVKITGGSFYNWNPENVKWTGEGSDNGGNNEGEEGGENTSPITEPNAIFYMPASDDIITLDRNQWYNIKKRAVVDESSNTERVDNLQDLLNNENVGEIIVTGSISENIGSNKNDPDTYYIYTITHDVNIDFGNVESTLYCYSYGFTVKNARVVFNNMNINANGIAMQNNSEVVFNGNRIDNIRTSSGGRYCFVVANSKLTINQGTFNNASSSSDARYMYAYGNSTIRINGGSWGFENKTTPSPPMYIDSPTELYITGGEFNFSPNSIASASGSIGNVYISGGTFTSSTQPTMHLASGYMYQHVEGTTNKWKVVQIAQ